jgi:hypothetical protein
MQTRIMRTLIAVGVAQAAAIAACIDTTPVIVNEEHPTPVTSDVKTACATCIEVPEDPGPGCGSKYADCQAEPLCIESLECALSRGCFELPEISDLTSCSVQCGDEIGLATDEGAYAAAIALFTCMITGPCKDACRSSADAAAGP